MGPSSPVEELKSHALGHGLDLFIKQQRRGWLALLLKLPEQVDQVEFVPCVGQGTAPSDREAGALALGDYLLARERETGDTSA